MMSKKEVQDKTEEQKVQWKKETQTGEGLKRISMKQTAREATKILENQTVREGTQVPSGRKNFGEEEFQQDEEDFFNILEEKRQYWQDVERIQEHKSWKVG